MIIIAFLIWFYHVPTLQVDQDELEWAESVTAYENQISFESGMLSFLRLQAKYQR